ncbi:MAG: tRNA dihydrouridine synthase DusB [Pseudomonadota bacterium]|nr:MAG: tRNA dihydrouridine synthase DusB [Pseudomonadota bacterium]
MTLTIGPVAIDGRAFLAPMSGVTDVGLRRLARRFGASLVVSEMVVSQELARGDEEARMRAEGEGVSPHVVQLAGCDPYWMAEAARVAQEAGADIIDINMGCPAKKVTGGWAGSALMRDLDHALRLIEAVVGAVRVPVTLKMRLGWDDANRNAPELACRAETAGVQLVTVHGRTRQQFYKGSADWAAVAAVRAATSLPLVVNGNICDTASAREALRLSGADAVMVGRAAVGRPWLVGEIARDLAGDAARSGCVLDAEAKGAAAVEHYETLLSLYGRDMGLRHARKHLAAYADHAIELGSARARVERARIVTSETPQQVIAALRAMFADVPLEDAA